MKIYINVSHIQVTITKKKSRYNYVTTYNKGTRKVVYADFLQLANVYRYLERL